MIDQVVEIPIEQYHRKRGGGKRAGGGKGEWIVVYLMCGSALADESVCPAIPHTANSTQLRSRTFSTRSAAVEFGRSHHGGFTSAFYSDRREMGQSPPTGHGLPSTHSSEITPACEPRLGIVPRSLYLRKGGECGLVATFGGSRMCHFKWRNEDRDRGVVAIRDSVKGSISD